VKLFRSGENLKDRSVLIMGLGTKDGGVGAALFFSSRGARVTVTDLRDAPLLAEAISELKGLDIRFVLGGHRMEDFTSADLVVRNPGINRENRYLAAAEASGAVVESPIGVFCELFTRRWTGVTGTKGKSFTTHLVSHILSSSGIHTVAAGNNCVSPLRLLGDDAVHPVLELSSWQLAEMDLHRKSPGIGCLLNFFPDHMDWYDSLEAYRYDKETIARHQSAGETLALPLDDRALREIPGSGTRLFFSSSNAPSDETRGCFVEQGWIVWKDPERKRLIPLASLPEHLAVPVHRDLIPPAVCCAIAAGVPFQSMAEGVVTFPGIPHRFQLAGNRGKIRFINDSAATTPESVMKALSSLQHNRVVLIAGGGGHKNLDYGHLASVIMERTLGVILFQGDPASARLSDALNRLGGTPLEYAGDMTEAVEKGVGFLNPDRDCALLLSPGCSGAPFFVDLFQRGNQFLASIRALTGEP